MKRKLQILTGFIIYFVAVYLIMSYENKKDHPAITDAITSKFLSLNNKFAYSMPKFKNYYFDFEYQVSGEDYKSSEKTYYEVTVVQSKYGISQWLSRGSMTADVPEVQASVRHFYDPTMPPGQRYLQDIAIGPIMSRAQENYPNPHIDQVDWAIQGDISDAPDGKYNHKYCWNNGKKWFLEAIEKSNNTSKDSLMAMAWRALGETLHLMEDMGCPAHVRDDSHPAPNGYGSLFGDPDTYEELVWSEIKTGITNEIADLASSGKVDQNLKSTFENAKNVRDIAHNFAVWTNNNFFTNQTIAGTNIYGEELKHLTHPTKEYASPKISEAIYDPDTKYYEGTVGGHTVKHCVNYVSLYEYLWLGKRKGYPILDEACVRSQASVLFPNIVEAGVNTIKLFIPQIVVSIDNVASNTISGTIQTVTDEEYSKVAKYSGVVTIKNLSNSKKVNIDCKDGAFQEKIDDLELKEDDMVQATISFGGMQIFSDKFTVQEQTSGYLCDIVKVYITYQSAKFSKEGSQSTYWDHELCSYGGHNDAPTMFFPSEQGKEFHGTWNGNTFKGTAKSSLLGPGTGSITVQVSGDGKTINSLDLSFENGYSDHNNFIIIKGDVVINNPINATHNFYPDYMMEYKTTFPNKDFISTFNYKVQCKQYPDMIYTLLPKDGRIEEILVRFEVSQ